MSSGSASYSGKSTVFVQLTFLIDRANAITYMVSCILGGSYLHKIGREVAIIIGLLLILV